MKLRWLVLVLGAAACNQVFDLSATTLPDVDGDGAAEGADNCPAVANADQVDRDGDGVGDACDTCPDIDDLGEDADGDGLDDACDACPRGVNHDEDADGAFDACDVCPGIPGAQSDADGDGVGDACERGVIAVRERIFFDGFAPPSSGWSPRFVAWEQRGDSYGPVRDPSSADDGPYHPQVELTGTSFQVETAVRPLGPGVDGDVFGLSLVSPDGKFVTACQLVRAGGQWRSNFNGDVVAVASTVTFRLIAAPGPPGLVDVACEIDGVLHGGSQTAVEVYRAVLTTSRVTDFDYFDAIR